MHIQIYQGHHIPEAQGVCVVIDVLRAFTTASVAFLQGAKEIIFVSNIEEALALKKANPQYLLMGELSGKKIDGFDFGNSPKEIERANIKGCTLVQRTTSGTQGVVGCSHAQHLFAASFLNADATIRSLLKLNPSHVSLIATGRYNGDEDLALADYLKAKLENRDYNLTHFLDRVKNSTAASRMTKGEVAYDDGHEDVCMAMKINHVPFAIQVFKTPFHLIGRPS